MKILVQKILIKVTDLISVEYFQFRPKFSKLLERKNL